MKTLLTALALALALLCACSTNISPDNPRNLSETFSVPMGYQEAYRLADAYARECHGQPATLLRQTFHVTGNLFSDTQSGVVRVSSPPATSDLQRFEIQQRGDGSQVTVRVMGFGIWGQTELDAATAAVRSGEIACR